MPKSTFNIREQVQEALKISLSYFKSDLNNEIDFNNLQIGINNYLVKNFAQSEVYQNSITELRSTIIDFFKIKKDPKTISKPKSKTKIQQDPNNLNSQKLKLKQIAKPNIISKKIAIESTDLVDENVSEFNESKNESNSIVQDTTSVPIMTLNETLELLGLKPLKSQDQSRGENLHLLSDRLVIEDKWIKNLIEKIDRKPINSFELKKFIDYYNTTPIRSDLKKCLNHVTN